MPKEISKVKATLGELKEKLIVSSALISINTVHSN
jgi:hypothetical protein